MDCLSTMNQAFGNVQHIEDEIIWHLYPEKYWYSYKLGVFHQHPATGRLLYHVFIGDSKPLTLQWPLLLGGGNLNPKNVSSKSPTRCIRSYFYEETFINLHYLLWTSVLVEPNICFHNMYTSRLHFHDLIFGASLLVSHLCSPLPFPKCSGFLSKRLFVDKNLSKWLGNKTFMTSTGSRRVLLGGRGGLFITLPRISTLW